MPAQTLSTAEESPDVLQFKNISYLFDTLDVNKDGKLNAHDFGLFARKICDQLGVDPDSDTGLRLSEAYDSFWDQLRTKMDTDHNGEVTKVEFAAGMEKQQDATSKYSDRITKIITDLLDKDKDGLISQSEYVKFSTGLGSLDETAAVNAFQQLDADGDGKVTAAELRKGLLQIASKDVRAPGTALLGQR